MSRAQTASPSPATAPATPRAGAEQGKLPLAPLPGVITTNVVSVRRRRAHSVRSWVTFRPTRGIELALDRHARDRGVSKSKLVTSIVRLWLIGQVSKPEKLDCPALRFARSGERRLIKALENGYVEPHHQGPIVRDFSRAVTAIVTPPKRRRKSA